MRVLMYSLCCFVLAVSCAGPPAAENAALPSVDGSAVKAHIQKLASDEMEGRAPGGKGEELATAYIADFYRSIGLKTEFQAVPLVGITASVSPIKLTGKASRSLAFGDDFIAWSRREQDTSLDAELIFCG